jgi:Domain of unknown function (DUF4136)
MRRLFQWAGAGISVLALTGCATMNVGSHVERGLNFAQYRTWDWGRPDALPVGDPRLDQNGFYRDHVEGSIEKQLAGRGLERSASATPDLLIHYHASTTRRIDVSRNQPSGNCYAEDCRAGVIEYEAVTLVLDLVDARTNTVIWRGWAQHRMNGMLGNPYTMARTIEEAVTRMLKRLPGEG